jgi:hypothetical protein
MNTSKLSSALVAIIAKRDETHKGSVRIDGVNLCCSVYVCVHKEIPVAAGYKGRSQKMAFNYRFRTIESRDKFVKDFMDKENAREEAKMAEKATPIALQVGDVLISTWGYEQTNVDYYKVLKLVGSTSVLVVKIGRQVIDTGDMQGKCVPDITTEIDEPFKRRVVNEDSIKIQSFSHAHKLEPVSVINGVKLYPLANWTSYA